MSGLRLSGVGWSLCKNGVEDGMGYRKKAGGKGICEREKGEESAVCCV